MERLYPNDCNIFSFGGLLLGGAVGVATRQLIEEKMHRLYALCGGILLGLLSLEIIPETFSSYEMVGPILGIAIGILVMSLLDNYCHHPMIHKKINKHGKPSFFSLSLYLFIIYRVDLR